MTKIGIILFQNMKYAPFLKNYEMIFRGMENISYDVIYFERDRQLQECDDEHHIPIKWCGNGTVSASKVEKAVNFALYPWKLRKVLKKKNYDFLVVLTTFPAVLLSEYLRKKYAGKYIVDIRDYTQEHNKVYYALEKNVISNSALNIISSPGFKRFLPKGDYAVMHNIDNAMISPERYVMSKKCEERIIISYIGTISYEQQCKKLIELVEKDDRFEFHFYGNQGTFKGVSNYIAEIGCERIAFYGAYDASQKEDIYLASDIVFNCYGNDSHLVQHAISNKYYDGAYYKKPLLVSPKTIMAELLGQYAYSLDLDTIQTLDKVHEWYTEIESSKFDVFANDLVLNAISENMSVRKKIQNTVESRKNKEK